MSALEHLADGILVINLDERVDRWLTVEKELGSHIDKKYIQRQSAIKGTALDGFGDPPLFRGGNRDRTWAGRAGCTLSHREAITFAVQAGWRSVLIIEDDIQLTNDFDQVGTALSSALENQHWDVCYLGFTDPFGPFRELAKLEPGYSLYRIYGCNTAHAYLVRDTAYDLLLKLLPTQDTIWDWLTRHRAIDRWYARTLSSHFRVLAVSPSIINQKQGMSDITGRSHEHDHTTEISPGISTVLPYALASGLRRIMFGVLSTYDSLRGFIKRRRGF